MTVHGGRSRADRRGRSVIDTECRNRECLRASGPPARSACGRGVVLIDRPRPAAGRVPRRKAATRPRGGGAWPRMSGCAAHAIGEYSTRILTRLASAPPGHRSAATPPVGSQSGGRAGEPAVMVTPRSPRRVRPHAHKTSGQYFPCKKLPTWRTPSLQLLAFCLAVGGRQEPTPAVGASR